MELDPFPGCCGATTVIFDHGDYDYAFMTDKEGLSTGDFETFEEFVARRDHERKALREEMLNFKGYLMSPLTVGIVAEYQKAVLHPILREAGWTRVRGATTVNPNTKNRLYLWYKDVRKATVVETKKRF